jgi:hypothetical protein
MAEWPPLWIWRGPLYIRWYHSVPGCETAQGMNKNRCAVPIMAHTSPFRACLHVSTFHFLHLMHKLRPHTRPVMEPPPTMNLVTAKLARTTPKKLPSAPTQLHSKVPVHSACAHSNNTVANNSSSFLLCTSSASSHIYYRPGHCRLLFSGSLPRLQYSLCPAHETTKGASKHIQLTNVQQAPCTASTLATA